MPDDTNSSQDDLSKEFDEIIVRTKNSPPRQPAVIVDDPLPGVKEETRPEVASASTDGPTNIAPVATPSPVAAPVAEVTAPATTPNTNTPGVLVMQWLAYAFWGWFALAVLSMSVVTFGYLVDAEGIGRDLGEVVAYPIAALVVLLLISFVIDILYSRHEPAKKTGPATVIMVIHAVIFALLGIAALVSIVFAMVNMSLNAGSGGGSEGARVTLYTGAVMMVVYALLTMRVVYGARVAHVRKASWALLGVLAVVIAVAGLLGPIARAAQTKQDRLIEAALPIVPRAVEDYVQQNKQLPKDLKDTLQYTGSYRSDEARELINQNLVRYKPNTKPPQQAGSGSMQLDLDSEKGIDIMTPSTSTYQRNTYSSYYYQLCVTYKYELAGSSYDRYGSDYETNSISTYSHPAGEKCYDLTIVDY